MCRIVSDRITSSDDTELGVHPITAKEYASQCHELTVPYRLVFAGQSGKEISSLTFSPPHHRL